MTAVIHKCILCGKQDHEVLRLVCLSKELLLCSECIDIAHEVAHEKEGTVKVSVSDLETMRRNSFIGSQAATWVNLVRRAVDEADRSLSITPQQEQP